MLLAFVLHGLDLGSGVSPQATTTMIAHLNPWPDFRGPPHYLLVMGIAVFSYIRKLKDCGVAALGSNRRHLILRRKRRPLLVVAGTLQHDRRFARRQRRIRVISRSGFNGHRSFEARSGLPQRSNPRKAKQHRSRHHYRRRHRAAEDE